jgi:glycogen(starch) synthase
VKILFLSNLYPPNEVGGYERLCFEVASGLAARGHQVYVLTSDYGGKMQDFPKQTVERSLKLFATDGDIYQPFSCAPEQRATWNTHNAEILARVVEQFEPHVIFAWNLYFFDPSLLEAIQKLKQPKFFLLTDNWLIAFLNAPFLQNYFVRRIYGRQSTYNRLLITAKHWLTISKRPGFLMRGHAIFASCFMRDFYNEANFRFDNETIIYHGVNLPEHPEEDFAVRKQMVMDGEIRLLVAGRIVEIKGVHTAIEALPLLIRALPEAKIRLTVLGDDRDRPYMDRLLGRIAELELVNMVDFAKPVAEGELFSLFQKHDIYLFPSFYEPFSLTLIHALGAGIPTIASNAGGNPEIVHHMQTGMLFSKGNAQKLAKAVTHLATNGNLRQSISEKARKIAKHYTFGHMLGEVEQLLTSIQ